MISSRRATQKIELQIIIISRSDPASMLNLSAPFEIKIDLFLKLDLGADKPQTLNGRESVRNILIRQCLKRVVY